MTATASHQEEWDDPRADFTARLTEAAYGVALRHGVKGSFADLQLAMWRELGAVVEAASAAPAPVFAQGAA